MNRTSKDSQDLPRVARIGNLTHDPELLRSSGGKPYARLKIAVNPIINGQREKTPEYYEIVCFASLAENAVQSLGKGDRVVVVGGARLENWNDKNGQPHVTKKILAEALGPDLRFTTLSRMDEETVTTDELLGDENF